VPQANIGQLMVYRKDLFDEAGIRHFPETWDEFLEAGIKLKAKAIHTACRWAWLRRQLLLALPAPVVLRRDVMDKAGKKNRARHHRDREAVDFVRKLYKEACIEDCVGWLDPANNKAFLTSQILVHQQRLQHHGVGQARPARDGEGDRPRAEIPRAHRPALPCALSVTHGVFAYGPDPQAAKDFLRWIMDPKQYRPWIASGDMYFAPYLHAFRQSARMGTSSRGQAVPESPRDRQAHVVAGASQPRHGAVINRWVVIDMFLEGRTGARPRRLSRRPSRSSSRSTVRNEPSRRGIAAAALEARAYRPFGLRRLANSWSESPCSAGSSSRRPCCSAGLPGLPVLLRRVPELLPPGVAGPATFVGLGTSSRSR